MIIQRDRFGYGLTVSGDNPVYVLSVRDGGAAHRAGINTNDQIIKVKLVLFYSKSSSLRLVFFLFCFFFSSLYIVSMTVSTYLILHGMSAGISM